QLSKVYVRSPFVNVPPAWEEALRAASPVAREGHHGVYFYPPPFLLDTVAPMTNAPDPLPEGATVRYDAKIGRYLHNLLRIRRFCRARIFDPSMSCHPLTITEWRAALWGDYEVRDVTTAQSAKADACRWQHRAELRNASARLFGRVARIPPYADDMIVQFEGRQLARAAALDDPKLRLQVLWESHEINFRGELMALDTLLVQRENWEDMHRWARERKVSSAWGEPSSVLSVIPSTSGHSAAYVWGTPDHPQWRAAVPSLCSFVDVMSRWPDFPTLLLDDIATSEGWLVSDFNRVSRAAIAFYVRTFVQAYHRLPVPPVCPPF
ncbi:hypothetical protein FKP32DRAFT_1578124, partial [Trametes sanguinea]